MRQIHIFYNEAIIWHIVSGFLKICTDLHEICCIWSQNYFCYWFLTIFWVARLKLFINNNKNNFGLKYCKFLANLRKSSEILEQCHVKYRNKKNMSTSSKVEFVCSLFGRNVSLKKIFRICLTFRGPRNCTT